MSNVIDIYSEGMRVSLNAQGGSINLFDFEAAFPSMSHSYLLTVLDYMGLPEGLVNFVRTLYDDNRCILALAGRRVLGFGMASGIRQGCPLFPSFCYCG